MAEHALSLSFAATGGMSWLRDIFLKRPEIGYSSLDKLKDLGYTLRGVHTA